MQHKLILDRAILCEMLGDTEFYRRCPIFLFLRESAQTAYKIYIEQLQGGNCPTCSDRSVMTPVIYTFISHCWEQHDLNPENLNCIKEYLGEKKRRQITRCEIYAKFPRRPNPLAF